MGRNEIRLRRQMMNAGRIARHRNYGELMARHERDLKIRRISKIITYFLIIIFLFIVFLIVSRWEKKQGRNLNGSKVTSRGLYVETTNEAGWLT